MAIYLITEPCIGVKEGSCVDVCPVACIHTTPDSEQYYIDPEICIECEQCEIVCPVDAIFNYETLPDKWQNYVAVNAEFFQANKSPVLPISRGEAQELVNAVLQFAEKRGLTMSVVVVDPKGDVVGQTPARGALLDGMDELAMSRAHRSSSIRLRSDGARPILDKVAIIGAIGVAGANDEELDNLCCEAGLMALSRGES